MSDNTPFSAISYDKTAFNDLSLTGETLKGRDFEECLFRNCSLINCTLEKCRLVNCKFENCVLNAVNPRNNTLKKAHFSYPEVLALLSCLDIIIE